MAKASANLFPYVHLVPAAAPASPAAGSQRLYLDSGNSNKLSRKDSSGTVVVVEGGGGASTAGQAEYTLAISTGGGTGTLTLGTPTVDATKSTDTTIATPGSGAAFTVATTGVYDFSAFLPLSSQPSGRNFLGISRAGTDIARASLNTNVSEDAWGVSVTGVHLAAGDVVTFNFYKQNASPACTGTMRFFITRR